jgi:hypothetical protein
MNLFFFEFLKFNTVKLKWKKFINKRGELKKKNYYFPKKYLNRQGYDKYIPLTSIIEQHKSCMIVPEEETEPVSPYGFGGKLPRADMCKDVRLECIYDDSRNETTQFPKWYQLKAETPLFQMTRIPIFIERMRSEIPFPEREVSHPKKIK